MNALGRNIEKGEIVVLKKELFMPKYQDINERLFVVDGGFGMLSSTVGTAIYGKFLSDAEKARYEGYDISVEETIEYQKSHNSNVNNL